MLFIYGVAAGDTTLLLVHVKICEGIYGRMVLQENQWRIPREADGEFGGRLCDILRNLPK